MSERIRAFSNGFEYREWTDANCGQCVKGYDEEAETFRCDIERALGVALISDGQIPRAIADRGGFTDQALSHGPSGLPCLRWRCKEFWSEDDGDEPLDRVLRRRGAAELPLFAEAER